MFGKARGQARLPEWMVESTIGTMPIGSSGYTVPWAMWADLDGFLWINGNYTLHRETGGTVQMKVTRHEDGFKVVVPRGEKYSPGGGHFVGGADALPVVSVR